MTEYSFKLPPAGSVRALTPYSSSILITAVSSQSGNFVHFIQSLQTFCGSSLFSTGSKPRRRKKSSW